MTPSEKLIQDAVEKMTPELGPEDKEKFQKLLHAIFIEGKLPYEAMGFSKEMVEYMYASGLRYYNNGNYERAGQVFEGLTGLDPDDSRFIKALAAAHHKQEHYPRASQLYYEYGLMEPEDPTPYYHMYDCFHRGGFIGDALFCVEEAIRRCGSKPEHAEFKTKLQLIFDNLNKEFETLEKEGQLTDLELPDESVEFWKSKVKKT